MRYSHFLPAVAGALLVVLTLGCAREHRHAETVIPPTSSFVKTWGGSNKGFPVRGCG